MKKNFFLIIFVIFSSSICEELQRPLHTSIFQKMPKNIRNMCAIIEICSSINTNEKVNKACGRIGNGIYCSNVQESPESKDFCEHVSLDHSFLIRDMKIIQEELNLHPQIIVNCCKGHVEENQK